MDDCQRAFEDLKAYFTSAPLLSPSVLGEKLYLYLAVTPHAVSSTFNVMTNHPLKKAMNKLEAAGRLIQWAVEFDIK